jgi:hypothetical protein
VTRRPVRNSPARRAVVAMMGSIVAVHTLAIAIYRLAGIDRRGADATRTFGAVWTAVTLVVVGVGLWRVRVARNEARAARRSGRGS